MEMAFIVALTFVCAYTFVEEVYALPSNASADETTIAATTAAVSDTTRTAKESLKDAMKAGKEARKSKKDCARDCGPDYDPICVHDPTDANFKPRSFGSQCALDVHNCEMGTRLAVKSKGECPGSEGIRLS